MGTPPNYIKRISLCLLATIFFTSVFSQQGFYVPKKGKIFFSGDTATIFSNVINEGKFGVGKKAVIKFKGRKWRNDPEAVMTDEAGHGDTATGDGGIIAFNNDSELQQLEGGFNQANKSGTRFSNIHIDNPFGVELENGTTFIWNNLHFSRGRLYLRNNLVVLGYAYPGEITGYDERRFIVAGIAPGDGALIRNAIKRTHGIVTFPVGTTDNGYAPAAIRSQTPIPDDYYVSVFDNVLSKAFTGLNLNEYGVNKTWHIGKLNRPRQDKTDIFLQHDIRDEGPVFSMNRAASYISQYQLSSWDVKQLGTYPFDGILTTGTPDENYGLNSTSVGYMSSSFFFTKFTSNIDSAAKTRLWFSAFRHDWKNAKLAWETKPEINNRYFVVQRRYGNEINFTDIDTILTKSIAGISVNTLHYDLMDPNEYRGITYYRLMMVDVMGNITYSNIVPVGNKPGNSGALIWPNPNRGRFFAGIYGDLRIDRIVIYNEIGQLIRIEKVNGRNIIELNVKIPGAYMVSFLSQSGNYIETKKVLVTSVE